MTNKSRSLRPKVARPFHIAIVGATGLVGKEVLSILHERAFPVASVKLLASESSIGTKLDFGDNHISVEALTTEAFKGVEIAFFALSAELSKKWVPLAAKAGAVCIDKSSAFRSFPDIPLVAAEVNPDDVADYKKKNIISCPNCTTTPLVQVLKPLHDKAELQSVQVATYQAVSGAGNEGIEELQDQVRALFNMNDSESKVFSQRIAFNLIPKIEGEEEKMSFETKRLLKHVNLKLSATCVRVPVFNGHSAAVNLSFKNPLTPIEAREVLAKAPGLMLTDEEDTSLLPTPVSAAGEDVTLVGRIREDKALRNGIVLFLSSDNLRTGAALNAVKVAEILASEHLT